MRTYAPCKYELRRNLRSRRYVFLFRKTFLNTGWFKSKDEKSPAKVHAGFWSHTVKFCTSSMSPYDYLPERGRGGLFCKILRE